MTNNWLDTTETSQRVAAKWLLMRRIPVRSATIGRRWAHPWFSGTCASPTQFAQEAISAATRAGRTVPPGLEISGIHSSDQMEIRCRSCGHKRHQHRWRDSSRIFCPVINPRTLQHDNTPREEEAHLHPQLVIRAAQFIARIERTHDEHDVSRWPRADEAEVLDPARAPIYRRFGGHEFDSDLLERARAAAFSSRERRCVVEVPDADGTDRIVRFTRTDSGSRCIIAGIGLGPNPSLPSVRLPSGGGTATRTQTRAARRATRVAEVERRQGLGICACAYCLRTGE